MKTQPYVGQRVRLNDHGYQSLHLTSAESIRQSQDMRITSVENLRYDDAPIWAIDVDQPAINMFLLDATMVDPR